MEKGLRIPFWWNPKRGFQKNGSISLFLFKMNDLVKQFVPFLYLSYLENLYFASSTHLLKCNIIFHISAPLFKAQFYTTSSRWNSYLSNICIILYLIMLCHELQKIVVHSDSNYHDCDVSTQIYKSEFVQGDIWVFVQKDGLQN